ncbi:hypothetical protein BDV95DRAFT_593707 [Massariosphaeria phaeospora]|uniref:Uncharacterized protein n=1 Tax=Massariosphaeria phaeospora TaxID=100035 RepID=A0A7C8I904_9PLEO|nr:hypothetical protein BDV95DRAFT_593707 [Massariosphaeria phaeospora]
MAPTGTHELRHGALPGKGTGSLSMCINQATWERQGPVRPNTDTFRSSSLTSAWDRGITATPTQLAPKNRRGVHTRGAKTTVPAPTAVENSLYAALYITYYRLVQHTLDIISSSRFPSLLHYRPAVGRSAFDPYPSIRRTLRGRRIASSYEYGCLRGYPRKDAHRR